MTSETVTEQSPMKLEEIIKTREFAVLTAKQKTFISQLIATGLASGRYNGTAAAAFSYTTKFPSVMACQLLKQRKIKRVMDLHFRRSNLDSILDDLKTAARKSARAGTLNSRTVKLLAAFERYVLEHGGHAVAEASAAKQVPADALEVWTDKNTGVVIGYRDADGEPVRLQ
jgi:hypothetical protein